MKTQIRRYSRSALSVLLTLCMLVSCFSVAIIGTDAAQVRGDSTGATKYLHWAKNREGIKTAGGTALPVTMDVSSGEFNVSVNESSSANSWSDITSVDLPDGVHDNNSQEFDGWHYWRLWFGSAMKNVTFSYDNGKLIVKAESRYLLMREGTSGSWTNLGSVTLSNDQASKTITRNVTSGTKYQFVLVKSVDSLSTADDAFAGNAIGVYGDNDLTPVSVTDGTKHYAQITPNETAKMNITIDIDAAQMTYTFHDEKLYPVTVAAAAGGSVTVASTTVGAGTSTSVDVGAVGLPVTATPSSGYEFAYWVNSDSTKAYVTQTGSASTTLKAAGSGGTVTAYFRKNLGSRTIYFDNSGNNWSNVYAYAEYTDELTGVTVKPLGNSPGTPMTSVGNGVYSIDLNWLTTSLTFSDAGSNSITTTHSGLDHGSDTVPQKGTVDETNRKNQYTASTNSWGTFSRPANQKSYTLDIDSTYKNMIYTGVTATMFDYYTDSEINASGGPEANWYTAIKANDDGWADGSVHDREPTETFNKALSEYAGQNGVKYPLYFGAFYTGTYNDPGYYHSGTDYKGNYINDSNALGESHKSLPGLTGTTMVDGNLTHLNKDAANQNGVPMALFDKDWLTSRASKSSSGSSNVVRLDPGIWNNAGDEVYGAYFFTNTTNDGWQLMTQDSSGYYTATNTNNRTSVIFGRFAPGTTQSSMAFNNSVMYSRTGDLTIQANKVYHITGWGTGNNSENRSTGEWVSDWTTPGYTYTGALAQIFEGQFPVRKEQKDKVTYYTFNSGKETESDDSTYNNADHYDTVYFTPSTKYGDSPVMKYSNINTDTVNNAKIPKVTEKHPGFYPFDNRNGTGEIGEIGKDYALGMKLEFEFTLGQNGQIKGTDNNMHDQKFEFSGDDDLWVFVDNNLVLDLGGDHKQANGTINFASTNKTGSVTVTACDEITKAATENITRNSTFSIENQDTTQIHTMTIYYLERGHHESNLKFGFSITPIGSVYTAEKEVNTDSVNTTLKDDVDTSVKNQQFTFTHKTSDSESGTYALSTGKTYTRTQSNGTTKTTTTTGSNGQFYLKDGENDLFTEQFEAGKWFEVKETSDSAYAFDVSTTVKDNVTGGDISVSNDRFKFLTTKPDAGPLDPTKLTQTFTNTVKTKDVTITKKIAGAYDPTATFNIEVRFKLPGESDWGSYPTMAFERDGVPDALVSSATLIHQNEKLVFKGIPEGTQVSVREIGITDTTNYRYASTAVTNGVDTVDVTNGATFYVGQYGDPVVTINNNKIIYRNLSVKKTVNGSDTADTNKTFKFYVEKYSGGAWVPIDSSVDTASTGRSIYQGQTVDVGDIEQGTQVRITEKAPAYPYDFNTMTATGANITVNTDGKSGTLTLANSDVVVTIDNNQVPKKDFTVTKVMQSGSAALNTGDTFTIKIETARTTDGTWPALANTAFTSSDSSRTTGLSTNDNGECTISAGETITFDDKVYQNEYIRVTEYTASLPADTSYVSVGATKLTDTDTQYSCTSVTNIQNYAGAYFKLVDDAAVTVTNYKTPRHNLTFTKNTDHTDTTTYFPVTVTVGGTQITSSNIGTYTFSGSAAPTSAGGAWYFNTTNNKFMVKKNGSVTIDRLLKGTAVNVVEDAVTNYTYTAASSSVANAANAVGTGTDPIVAVTGGFSNIKIGDNDVTVTIYNTVAKAGLTITKALDSDIDDYGTNFDIQIWKKTVGSDDWTAIEDTLTYSYYDFDSSNHTATWKANQTLTPIGTISPKYYQINNGCQLVIPNLPVGTQIKVVENNWASDYYEFDSMELSNGATATITNISDTTDPQNPIYGSVVTMGTTNDTLTINNEAIRETVVITKTTDYDLNDTSKFYVKVETKQFNSAGNVAYNNNGSVMLNSTATAQAWSDDPDDENDGNGIYIVEKSGTITFTNVPRGTYFKITEPFIGQSAVTNRQRFSLDWVHVGSGTENEAGRQWSAKAATKGGTVDVDVRNKIMRNTLTIAKNITDSTDVETKHTITVTAKKDSTTGAAYSSFYYKSSKDAAGTALHSYTAGAAIQYVQGETLSFFVDVDGEGKGILFPVGTYFTVKETVPGDTYVFDSFAHTTLNVVAGPDADHPAEITFYTLDATTENNLIVHNRLDTILYQIRYQFPSRPYLIGANAGKPQYGNLAYTTEVTTAQKDETIETVSGVERIKKSVLQANEPYEKNFMTTMTFDYDNAEYSIDTSGVKKIYKATVKATSGTLPTKRIEFFFPYEVKKTTVTAEAGETITGLDGIDYYFEPTVDTPELGNAFQSAQVLSEGVLYQSNPIITKTKVVQVTNDEGQTEDQTITQRFGTTAARTTSNGAKFLYWSIRSKNKNIAKDNNAYQYVEVARCYEPQFNYTVFDDYKVYAIYEGGPGADGTEHDKDTDQYTTINFLDYSRNNWTGNDKGDYPYNNGDVVWTDFDVAYENGYVELAATSDKTEIGILVEKVQDDLDKDSENKDISMDPTADNYANNYAHYAAKEENRTAVETFLKTTAASEKDANNNLKYSRKVINKSDLTNKGRTEYGYGLFVENNGVEKAVAKNALYRAYSYIKVTKDGETSIILCDTPVYFSVKHEANK